jgi:glycolate oxidase FAD binding subunit
LHTGALGAFGVIVEASFKLAPLPAATRSFGVRCPGLEEAEALAFDVRERALSTRALALLPPAAAEAAGLPAAAHVLVELAGVEAAVERSADEVRDAAAGRGADAKESSGAEWERLRSLAGSNDGVVLRTGVPASEVRAAVEAAEAAGCTAWGHLAAGSVIACAPSMQPETVRSLRAHAREAGGFLQIESAPASLRSQVDPFDAGETELVRALKRQFDPAGTLNRGRWMAGV